jgi:hypothetical protein
VPEWTRAWLIEDRRHLALQAGLLVLTSLIVAGAFRRWIGSAESFAQHLTRAAVIPYVGCLIYLTLWNLWAMSRDLRRGGGVNLHDSLVLYPWGLAYTLAACFVIVPYGLLCQYVMSRMLEENAPPAPTAP